MCVCVRESEIARESLGESDGARGRKGAVLCKRKLTLGNTRQDNRDWVVDLKS